MHRPNVCETAPNDLEGHRSLVLKRPRFDQRSDTKGEGTCQAKPSAVIDLSMDSPTAGHTEKMEAEPAAAGPSSARSRLPGQPGGRPLWGELEDPSGPPRWRHVRRRTATRTPTCSMPEAASCSDACPPAEPDAHPMWRRPWETRSREAVCAPIPSTGGPVLPQRPNAMGPPPFTRRSAALASLLPNPPPHPPGPSTHPTAGPSQAPSLPLRPPSARAAAAAGATDPTCQPPARTQGGSQRSRGRQPARQLSAWAREAEEDANLAIQMDRLGAMDAWALPSPSSAEAEEGPWTGWHVPIGPHPTSGRSSRGMSITDAMLSMLRDESFAPPVHPANPLHPHPASLRSSGTTSASASTPALPHLPRPRRSGAPHALELRHLSALREAMMDRGFGGAAGGRLPLHLLLSDRDFDENDYEALLALDDGIESRKGATPAAIAKLPTVVVGPKAGQVAEGEASRCAICLEDYVQGVVQRKLKCSHRFHCSCLDRWLARKATCPICQQPCCD
ncbi:hypothetical protein WJX73_006498 [Symbiochloris irregularis]|uniref:RING-type domain-containing protein n=1 Tax=Symbiochloris irregularis TaxID=706552 RepID=A0AAW1PS21_9CHLO